jgi:drug/metabolite transporter (DMT)-like permease
VTGGALRRRRTAEWVLLAVTAVWGLTFPAIKLAVAEVRPSVFMVVRFGLALLGLFLLTRGRYFRGWKGHLGAGLLLGGLLYASYAFQAVGLASTSATRSAFITGLSILLVPFFYVPIRRRWPGLRPTLGAFLSIGGLLLMTRPDLGPLNVGDLLTFGTAVSYALYVVLLEVFTQESGEDRFVGMQGVVMALLALLWLPLFEPDAVAASHPGPATWLSLLVTVPVAMFSLVALTRYQKATTATRAAVIYSAEPVFALLFAALWIGERLDLLGLGGAGLIMAGILVAVSK